MRRVPAQILELPGVVHHPESVPVTPAQQAELERRWRSFEQHPDEGESWDDVKRSLLDE
ncbi:MAG TPA: addiction module protein [Thermoanaerobaculia bacterium]|jgi:putative addiction module component (TIGR02574 family)